MEALNCLFFLALKGLDLYAPQTAPARWGRSALRLMLRCGLLAGLKKITLSIDESDPFAAYLNQQAGVTSAQFALLMGNPNTRGQRCIFLLFDRRGDTAAVVKAGADSEGVALITSEESFLKNVSTEVPGIPKLRSTFSSDRVRALTLDFFPGSTPATDDWSSAGKLLNAWLNPNRVVVFAELAVWERLLPAAGHELPARVREIGGTKLCPAIFHGDFAPWNARVNGNVWTLLDWERGELVGPPLWDWLHFVIQPAILVKQADPESIVRTLEKLFQFPLFIEYAARAKIAGLEWRLAEAYLQYCLHVLRQAEGWERIRALAESGLLAQMVG